MSERGIPGGEWLLADDEAVDYCKVCGEYVVIHLFAPDAKTGEIRPVVVCSQHHYEIRT